MCRGDKQGITCRPGARVDWARLFAPKGLAALPDYPALRPAAVPRGERAVDVDHLLVNLLLAGLVAAPGLLVVAYSLLLDCSW